MTGSLRSYFCVRTLILHPFVWAPFSRKEPAAAFKSVWHLRISGTASRMAPAEIQVLERL